MIFRFETGKFQPLIFQPPIMGGGWKHEQGATRSFPVVGFHASIRARQVYQAVSWRPVGANHPVLFPIRGHGIRSTDLPRKLAGHRYVSERDEGQALSSRNPRRYLISSTRSGPL